MGNRLYTYSPLLEVGSAVNSTPSAQMNDMITRLTVLTNQHEAWEKHARWRASQKDQKNTQSLGTGSSMTEGQRALTDGVSKLITAMSRGYREIANPPLGAS